MNWQNFDKLRAHIAGLLNGREHEFNYGFDAIGGNRTCGCVAWHAYTHLGARVIDDHGEHVSPRTLREFLGITTMQAMALYYNRGKFRVSGDKGIADALTRLDELAARYKRPSVAKVFQPDEAAFLASVRALVGAQA